MRARLNVIASIAGAALLLGGLYWGLRSSLDKRDERAPQSLTFKLSIPAEPAEELDLAAFPVFKAVEGDTITLVVNSARPGSFHVHGYEKQVELVPGRDVALTFEAEAAGLYPLHLHDPDPDRPMEHQATLEVHPR